jgi:hypothetical protein
MEAGNPLKFFYIVCSRYSIQLVYDIQILASHHIHIEANEICIHVSNDKLEETQVADLPLLAVSLYSPSN